MAPITIYNILIIIVYATLFWYLYKEEQNTKVIELNRPAGSEEVKFSKAFPCVIDCINCTTYDFNVGYY